MPAVAVNGDENCKKSLFFKGEDAASRKIHKSESLPSYKISGFFAGTKSF
jgi:hypothetical protein